MSGILFSTDFTFNLYVAHRMNTTKASMNQKRGRDANGKKMRWSAARKKAAKRARTVRDGQVCDTTNASWENLPVELWANIILYLEWEQELDMVTLSKKMMGKFGGKRGIGLIRSQIREKMEDWRKEQDRLEEKKRQLRKKEEEDWALYYEDRMQEAIEYYIQNNYLKNIPGVSFQSVAKEYQVIKGDLKERVAEAWLDYGEQEEDFDW